MNKEEKAIYHKLTESLKAPGDRISLAEIHPGEWLSACLNPTDIFSSLEPELVRVNDVTVINGADPMSLEVTWGLYFVYPNSQIEYYSFPNSKILADTSRGYPSEGKNCAKRKDAFIELKETIDNRLQVKLVGE